ncbi:uncharacterized protein TRIREDRAFT_57045 [Trichoderma reesei QM6a]|jgi:pimeloyl-ACP methyl ester carboxylesterase|uniref:Predicted protein n=2 Tax=Hypocrea jecorina TaxID=51453 RepID=G0RB72_HYPJQ|nr:uncharacterized protein TRIREDRAFT_57045 [Trichoderma reesei QM6a]EGR51307.1 predicted protein [Trichoderma reesei QM6a]ETS04880.1 alpha/beta-hydrolase [Trichoderma reesei RUT C-30]
MDNLIRKTVKTSRGFLYTYYTSQSSNGKPTAFLLHGWPDHAPLWEDLATNHIIPKGYGVIIPDCLGFGDSSKPTRPEDFHSVGLTGDLRDILDAENVDQVVVSGHDSGAGLAHRFYAYHPERCSGLFIFNVAASPQPQRPFSLEEWASMSMESMGYFPAWYWYLFCDPLLGPSLLNQHAESLFTALHAEPKAWMTTLCAEDGLKAWLKQDKKGPVQQYATDEMRLRFIKRMTRDGFESPLCYYRSKRDGRFDEQDSRLPADRYKIKVPYLFVAGTQDVVCRPEAIETVEKLGLVPQLTVRQVDAGHWCMLAKPDEVGKLVVEWLDDTYRC